VIPPELGRRLKTAVKLGVTGTILYLIFTFVPFAEVVRSIRMAHVSYLLLAAVMVIAGPFLSAGRLKVLTDAQGLSFSALQIVHVNFVAAFYGLALPGQLAGGAIRWRRLWLLERRKEEILAAIVYGRIIHLVVLCVLGLAFLAADLPQGVEPGAIPSLLVLVAFLGVLTWVGVRADRLRWLQRRSSDSGSFAGRLAAATGLYRRLPRRKMAAVFGFAIAENIAAVLGVLFLAAALEIDVAWITLGWIRSVVQAVTSLPLSISGLGVREGGMIMLLEPYGISGARAVALSFLMLGRGLLLGMVGGLLEARDHLASGKTARHVDRP
jgi:uncharacterized membrane protein YbhN (UPF0104 family)